MIRVLFMLGLCLSVLAGSSAALVTAHPSNDPPPPASSPYRYGGKITALRPPGANGPTAPADTHPGLHLPSLPLSLPVFGTDVNVGGGNETSIAANPANPLNFLAGANNTARWWANLECRQPAGGRRPHGGLR